MLIELPVTVNESSTMSPELTVFVNESEPLPLPFGKMDLFEDTFHTW
jgi:hypothetical protein